MLYLARHRFGLLRLDQEHFREKLLQHRVLAQYLLGLLFSLVRQRNDVIRSIIDQPLGGQNLQRGSHRRTAHAEPIGDIFCADSFLLQNHKKHRLEVILQARAQSLSLSAQNVTFQSTSQIQQQEDCKPCLTFSQTFFLLSTHPLLAVHIFEEMRPTRAPIHYLMLSSPNF